MTQGFLVCLLRIALMLRFSLIDPTHIRPFFTTSVGWMMMILVFILDGIGMWLMSKFVKVDA